MRCISVKLVGSNPILDDVLGKGIFDTPYLTQSNFINIELTDLTEDEVRQFLGRISSESYQLRSHGSYFNSNKSTYVLEISVYDALCRFIPNATPPILRSQIKDIRSLNDVVEVMEALLIPEDGVNNGLFDRAIEELKNISLPESPSTLSFMSDEKFRRVHVINNITKGMRMSGFALSGVDRYMTKAETGPICIIMIIPNTTNDIIKMLSILSKTDSSMDVVLSNVNTDDTKLCLEFFIIDYNHIPEEFANAIDKTYEMLKK